MKTNKNHNKARYTGPPRVPIHFKFTHPTAINVCLAGTFNDWHPADTMRSSGDGDWWNQTTLAPGTYEYCLVVDGKWMPDPLARETVPNPYGGRNSVLKVGYSSEAAHLAEAENAPLKNTKL